MAVSGTGLASAMYKPHIHPGAIVTSVGPGLPWVGVVEKKYRYEHSKAPMVRLNRIGHKGAFSKRAAHVRPLTIVELMEVAKFVTGAEWESGVRHLSGTLRGSGYEVSVWRAGDVVVEHEGVTIYESGGGTDGHRRACEALIRHIVGC